ncbi:WD40 repeat domain-containing protein [Flavobacterium sedimenticola]|uniref:WD40 repeat domain-containing protein n=1 Tax=Flavobacterium sedimenticola TaxID=3043286 RepID=A0ABT6XS40_9FLAO|nr:hypothetical protein [Flavobacterium sedimenticola]MDI9257909.1 hypothetical protein [Flavobacterium sedimenticola]
MKNNSICHNLFLFFLLIFINVNAQDNDGLYLSKMTGINSVSYTDVYYTGSKDTVLVSKYDGTIEQIVKGSPKSKKVAKINDEIYAITYNFKRKHIAASTLENGIVIINKQNGKVIKKLSLIQTWALRIDYSNDSKFLFANDQRGNRFIWDVDDNYNPIKLPEVMPKGSIYSIKNNVITLITSKKIILWNFLKRELIKEINISASRIADVDLFNNYLNLNFNSCDFFDVAKGKSLFSLQHPSWIRPVESIGGEDAARTSGFLVKNGFFEDTHYQMALTSAKFAKNRIYTASIDKSIRVWDKETGTLIDNLIGHKGTVNKIKVNATENQLVSIDLLGGIKFWNLLD